MINITVWRVYQMRGKIKDILKEDKK